MSLRERLISRIASEGPIRVSTYMTACLHDPAEGYYARRPKLGAEGDFITAPLVSQMFGELLGLWAVGVWHQLGQPDPVRLIELGPGDGTMMSDVLRAARASPAFRAAIEVWLVETSEPLRALQANKLAGAPVRWIEAIDDLPGDQPAIVLANEFLDCIPIDQWTGDDRERRIGLDGAGALAFVVEASGGGWRPVRADDVVVERSQALAETGQAVGRLFATTPGAGVFIDYGRARPYVGDTLQALRGHRKESPLAHPGKADLTAHVDFPAFVAAVHEGGAQAAPLLSQADFLASLGLEARAAALATANPGRAGLISRQVRRLVGADQMGELFKVSRVHSRGIEVP